MTNVNYDLKLSNVKVFRYPSSCTTAVVQTTELRPRERTQFWCPKVLAKAFVSNVVYNLSLRDDEKKKKS